MAETQQVSAPEEEQLTSAEEQHLMRIGKRCYVGNLAWKTSWQDLKDTFRECGSVVYANVMRDDTGTSVSSLDPAASSLEGGDRLRRNALTLEPVLAGRSKGWGIVEFESPEEVCLTRCWSWRFTQPQRDR